MKAAVCVAPGNLVLEDRPEPEIPRKGWALLAVEQVGICGTDFHIFEGKHPFLAYPRIMGHEVSGTVIAVGDDVGIPVGQEVYVNPYLACGECVACRQGKPNCCVKIEVLGVHRDGGMCERMLVPAGNLYPTAGLSLSDAAAVEFLAIGAHAVRRSLAEKGRRILVLGAGPIGLGVALFARLAGHGVAIADAAQDRLEFAKRQLDLEAVDMCGKSCSCTGDDGFDVVFDATGNARSMEAAFGYVAHGGALVLVSIVKDIIRFSDPEFHKREMMLIGSRNALRGDFEHVAASILNGSVPVSKLVTHRTSLEHIPDAMARWTGDKSGLVKAVIEVGVHP